MYQVYHSSNIVGMGGSDSNHYHIADAELDQLILEGRAIRPIRPTARPFTRLRWTTIIDWAVEIPVYQRQNCIIFSAERINMDTVTRRHHHLLRLDERRGDHGNGEVREKALRLFTPLKTAG